LGAAGGGGCCEEEKEEAAHGTGAGRDVGTSVGIAFDTRRSGGGQVVEPGACKELESICAGEEVETSGAKGIKDAGYEEVRKCAVCLRRITRRQEMCFAFDFLEESLWEIKF